MVPYLGYNAIHYGHLMPISGAIKSTFPYSISIPTDSARWASSQHPSGSSR